jgi:hypothetical protein
MHKSATKCNETLGKWCKNKHGASKIIDTLETYQLGTESCPEMDGSDHVSSVQMLIGRRGSLNLKNGQLVGGHVGRMNGQDFQCGDGLRFPQECFF